MTRSSPRIRCALAALNVLVVLTGCGVTGVGPFLDSEGTPSVVDAEGLPSITETKAQMLALIDEVQVAVSAVVPATRPWRWKDHWGSGTCLGISRSVMMVCR